MGVRLGETVANHKGPGVLATAKEDNVRNSVAWVATGCPLNNAEIQPRPARLNILVNSTDPVGRLIGLRGGPPLMDTILLKTPQH